MGNTFGFLRPETDGGFKFSVLDACKAEHIDLSRNCNLDFGPGHELLSIGNIKRGSFTPNPGIAGEGVSQKSPLLDVSLLIRTDMAKHDLYVRYTLRRPRLSDRGASVKI